MGIASDKLIKGFLTAALLLNFQGNTCVIQGQSVNFNYFYRICFTDKGSYQPSDFLPSELLSNRAVDRRNKAGVTVPDYKDMPVYPGYIDQVKSKGLTLHCKSRWMNSALFKSAGPADISELQGLSFVREAKAVKFPGNKGPENRKTDMSPAGEQMLQYNDPLLMINGTSLHNSGYNGKGILIAVFDGGFTLADRIPALAGLRARGGIKGTADFVTGNGNVYSYSSHGTAVMTVLAGELPGMIEGTATGSDYWLLRTEDTSSEYPVEEDFWISAAEFADSAGADIISSSLGYFKFDDPSLNYIHGDMDGNSAFVTEAADIAASRGILVVASAGNERNKDWITIIAPSDGDSVLCTGAVDANNLVSAFSSSGPAADGRTKPDVMALGVGVPVQVTESEVRDMNGTSFSCPVISGICASVMQAVPGAVNTDIIDAVKRSSDKYHSPDSLYGYGLPDMVKALGLLQEKHAKEIESTAIISPNPFTGIFQVIFRESPGYVKMEIFNIAGRVIFAKNYDLVAGRSITIPELQFNEQGIYFLRMSTPGKIITNKLIKTDW